MKNKCIIIDLDGTLANIDHRRTYVQGSEKNWNKFFEGIESDKLNGWCGYIVRAINNCNSLDAEYSDDPFKVGILLVTGRMEKYAPETLKFLEKFHIVYDDIYFRKDEDYRPDYIVKLEILHKHILAKYRKEDILFAIDDRKQVVDMWRNLGIVCLPEISKRKPNDLSLG